MRCAPFLAAGVLAAVSLSQAAVAAPDAGRQRGTVEGKSLEGKSLEGKSLEGKSPDGKAREGKVTEAKVPVKPQSLDELFARLKASEDPAEAKGVARLIERRLDHSGSATADLLTDRARQAMTGHDFPLAAELMDRVTALEPTWAEGWNRRATVFWLLSDKDDAVADLQRALVLEPRHFEAWAALGRIYESLEDKTRALSAFRRAQALYPKMERIQEAIDRLAPEVDGRDL